MDPAEYYYNVNSVTNDSKLYVIMEHYKYNIWALIALILLLIIAKNTNTIYLFNFLIIISLTTIFTYLIILKRF